MITNKQIYLLLKKEDEDLLYYVKTILNPDILKRMNDNLYYLSFSDDIEEFTDTIKNLSIDFFSDIVSIEVNYELPSNLLKHISRLMYSFESGLYKISDVLEKVVLDNIKDIKVDFKRFYKQRLSQEVIETGLSYIENHTSLKASKLLYIHRNTLAYRLETIKKVTMLDLKEFKSQLVFYGLFK